MTTFPSAAIFEICGNTFLIGQTVDDCANLKSQANQDKIIKFSFAGPATHVLVSTGQGHPDPE